MLGYVRCDAGEMLVKHHRLYEAIYCGLCRSVRKNTSVALLPFFSYDFVFLATLRMLLSEEKSEVEKQFCFLHPFGKKKMRIKDNSALAYSATASLLLTLEKMEDDLRDGDCPACRRMLFYTTRPFLRRALKKKIRSTPALADLCERTREAMRLSREEEKKGAGLDALCSRFALVLSEIFSFGTEGNTKRLLSALADPLGRWIYTVDALDDLEKDEKKGSFNPLLLEHGSSREVKKHYPEFDMVLSFYLQEMKKILDLTDTTRAEYAVLNNIITRGLPAVSRPMIKPEGGEKDERSV